MRLPLAWSTAAASLLAGALAVLVWVVTAWTADAAHDALEDLALRTGSRVALNRLSQRLVDAEASQRGYLLTGRASYLEPYRNAETDVVAALDELRRGHVDDARISRQIDQLADTAREKLSELHTTIDLFDRGEHEAWREVLLTDIGREKMQAVRAAVERLRIEEDARISSSREVLARAIDRGRLTVQITTLLALVWLIFFLRKTAALQRAQRAYTEDLRDQRDRLEARVGARTAELRELNAHLQDLREAERSRLALVLHDDLGALLTAAKLDLTRLGRHLTAMDPEAAGRLEHLRQRIDESVSLKRRLIDELAPSALHTLGLRTALEILASHFRRDCATPLEFAAEDLDVPDSARIVVYRLVQEGLDNIVRHAGAQRALVTVAQRAGNVVVHIRDDGVGFDPDTQLSSGHGLRRLRLRIEALGGSLVLRSAPGRGTEIDAVVPMVDLGTALDEAEAATSPKATPAAAAETPIARQAAAAGAGPSPRPLNPRTDAPDTRPGLP